MSHIIAIFLGFPGLFGWKSSVFVCKFPKKHSATCSLNQSIQYKMLSYRRETALQGAL